MRHGAVHGTVPVVLVFFFYFIICISCASKMGLCRSRARKPRSGEVTVAQSRFKDVAVVLLLQQWVLLNG